MARQLGHVQYNGTIGEIRHFKIKGKSGNFAGLKGGATGEQIKSSPSFIRTRENMNEFGATAAAGRSLRMGLNLLMKQMSDGQLTGRLTGIMKRINLEDQTEARGYRAIQISTQRKYLMGLQFNKELSFENVFPSVLSLTNTATRDSSTLLIEDLDVKNGLLVSTGATHFRMINALSVLSDFAYNASSKSYEAVNSELNELSKVSYSDYLDLSIDLTAPISVTSTLALPAAAELTEEVSVLNSIGIEFYQKVGTSYYLLKGSALKIYTIF